MILNYNVFSQKLDTIDFSQNKIINTINPHSYCVSKQDKNFEKALKASHILLPDGIGIVWAERLLNGTKIKKIAGYDLFVFLLEKLNQNAESCFFLGASEDTLKKIEVRLKQDYPNITVHSYSPPFKATFSEEDSLDMCARVNKYKPNVLFVGMTAPKQEKWIFSNHENLKVKNVCAIGAVFDFYAGNVERSSKFWIGIGLEWLPRLLKEPRRLARRNLVSTPKFILEVLSFKLFKKGVL